MAALSMFSLGVFVGALVSVCIRKIEDWSNATKVLSALVAAALSGSALGFLQMLDGVSSGGGLFYYPVGLVVAYMWTFSADAVLKVQDSHGGVRALGWLYLGGVLLVTIAALLLLLSPRVRGLLPS